MRVETRGKETIPVYVHRIPPKSYSHLRCHEVVEEERVKGVQEARDGVLDKQLRVESISPVGGRIANVNRSRC